MLSGVSVDIRQWTVDDLGPYRQMDCETDSTSQLSTVGQLTNQEDGLIVDS